MTSLLFKYSLNKRKFNQKFLNILVFTKETLIRSPPDLHSPQRIPPDDFGIRNYSYNLDSLFFQAQVLFCSPLLFVALDRTKL